MDIKKEINICKNIIIELEKMKITASETKFIKIEKYQEYYKNYIKQLENKEDKER